MTDLLNTPVGQFQLSVRLEGILSCWKLLDCPLGELIERMLELRRLPNFGIKSERELRTIAKGRYVSYSTRYTDEESNQRHLSMYADRTTGMTFAALGQKYAVCPPRAKQMCEKAVRIMNYRAERINLPRETTK